MRSYLHGKRQACGGNFVNFQFFRGFPPGELPASNGKPNSQCQDLFIFSVAAIVRATGVMARAWLCYVIDGGGWSASLWFVAFVWDWLLQASSPGSFNLGRARGGKSRTSQGLPLETIFGDPPKMVSEVVT